MKGKTKATRSKSHKLFRSRKDRFIAGVCGGLGEHFGIDSVWIRLIFILCTLLGGAAVLIYLILWAIVPLAPKK